MGKEEYELMKPNIIAEQRMLERRLRQSDGAMKG